MDTATPPPNWDTIYKKIEEMRSKSIAPVDTMGCASWTEGSTPEVGRYRTLISLMLSSQTKDTMTALAMKKLIQHGLNVDKILETDDDTLNDLISNVGFHNRKVVYIKKTTKILKEEYNGDVPTELEDVLKLPGVGPKMAYLFMAHAWDKPIGIGVDVHVHRISNRLGWVQTDTPEKTRMALQAWLPQEYWGKSGINYLLVGFGQTICTPTSPKCDECTVNDLCPSAFKFPKFEKKKKKTPTKRKPKKESISPKQIKDEEIVGIVATNTEKDDGTGTGIVENIKSEENHDMKVDIKVEPNLLKEETAFVSNSGDVDTNSNGDGGNGNSGEGNNPDSPIKRVVARRTGRITGKKAIES
eukprot:TRINITY_DN5342_c0_g1_i1.p1 TRINITY_DN5342_c0_g1~~TRINITY_DN5342_c0_g1_i1.p1  ORF type:complete len:357 (-),score=93.39 TRINITY_DN5342_c0_g1_i1:80-1150(-)